MRRVQIAISLCTTLIAVSAGNLVSVGVKLGNWQVIIMAALSGLAGAAIFWIIQHPQLLWRAGRRGAPPSPPASDPGDRVPGR